MTGPIPVPGRAVPLSGRAVLTAGGTTEELGVHGTVRGAEPGSPELDGRGFPAVVSLDPVAQG